MIINSPVGRFPFEATSIRINGGRVRLEGAMGTWPTSVEVPIAELPRIIWRTLPSGTSARLAGSVVAVALVALVARRRTRSLSVVSLAGTQRRPSGHPHRSCKVKAHLS
jgi:hypothetical protein